MGKIEKFNRDELERLHIFAGIAMNGLMREFVDLTTIESSQIAKESYLISEALIIEGRKYNKQKDN